MPLNYDVREFSFVPLVYILGGYLLDRLTRVLFFFSFSFVMNFIFVFTIFLAGHNYK